MGRISLATRLCEMPTMIRPKRTFAANNATATTQNARPLSGSSLGDRYKKKPGYRSSRAVAFGADNGARTRDPNLGKVVLYQLSHVRLRGLILRDARILCKNFF